MPDFTSKSQRWLNFLKRIDKSPRKACEYLYKQHNHKSQPIVLMREEAGLSLNQQPFFKKQMLDAGFEYRRVNGFRREFLRIGDE